MNLKLSFRALRLVLHIHAAMHMLNIRKYIDDLVHDCCNFIANALELQESCTKPSILNLRIVVSLHTSSMCTVDTVSKNSISALWVMVWTNFHGPPGGNKQPRQNHLSYGIICSRFYCNIIDALPPGGNYVYAFYTLYVYFSWSKVRLKLLYVSSILVQGPLLLAEIS